MKYSIISLFLFISVLSAAPKIKAYEIDQKYVLSLGHNWKFLPEKSKKDLKVFKDLKTTESILISIKPNTNKTKIKKSNVSMRSEYYKSKEGIAFALTKPNSNYRGDIQMNFVMAADEKSIYSFTFALKNNEQFMKRIKLLLNGFIKSKSKS